MPHSLVLNLVPKSPIYPEYLTGRHLHALFLTLVSSVDRSLGDRLHEDTAQKAFTIGPIQTNKRPNNLRDNCLQWYHTRAIPANSNCWWRISLLDDSLFGELAALWLQINPKKPWHLGPTDLLITSILATPQSSQLWANSCSYSQLYENASDTNKIINFYFATPTSFRQGKYDTAMPSRECVFNSLLSRWNKYSGIEFSEIPLESIFSSYFDINTEIFADSRSKFIGFVGESSYRIMGDVEPVLIKRVNALADFALYCGVGKKTTMGMGMARRFFVNN